MANSSQSGFVDNWQRGKSVTECNLHMLETEDFTDVTFLVGSEKHVVRAHRYVLASRSCVFHAMFCGPLAEIGDVTVPDIEVNVFKALLRFLYTDSCTINSENVAGLLYTSRKYDLVTLFTQLTSYLEEYLSEGNLCEVLEKSHEYGETDLEQKALKMLSEAGPKVITSVQFLELCSGCFGTFLKSENLNLKEEEVFEAALSWTKDECEREGLIPSHENMRKILGELVYEIRFACLSLEFIIQVVGPSRLLNRDEVVQITERVSNASTDISPFKSQMRENGTQTEERTNHGICYVKRFDTMLPASRQSKWFALMFSANRDISLLGCQLYGSNTEQTINLDIQIFDDQKYRISHPVDMVEQTLSDTVNDVLFPEPILIQAGRVYILLVFFPSNFLCFSGSGGQYKVMVSGVEFTFVNSTDWGIHSVEEGQVPGLIWQ